METWTNLPDSVTSFSPSDRPVAIYASLTSEDLPVSGARVVATVVRPGGAVPRTVSLELRDNGLGYPDVTEGDGVYSAYLTEYGSEPGFYSFEVEATHNDGKARYGI